MGCGIREGKKKGRERGGGENKNPPTPPIHYSLPITHYPLPITPFFSYTLVRTVHDETEEREAAPPPPNHPLNYNNNNNNNNNNSGGC